MLPTFSVTDFVASFNQTLQYAYPSVTIVGELSNLRVSKGKWLYFDLKDEYSSVKFFGTVYQLPGPLEDGMMVQVSGTPRLHNQFGFSVSVSGMLPVGEGAIKKASDMLLEKLTKEGLFDQERKRTLPYPPKTIGLITSGESAAYHDFIKILQSRWGGVVVRHKDVQVQGESAIGQIVQAIDYFNVHAEKVDVLVVVRGGGSADDLAVFGTEQVTRAVAGSTIPTLVAIGHEVDVSLAELAADLRASTPSNAAELLVPDKQALKNRLIDQRNALDISMAQLVTEARATLVLRTEQAQSGLTQSLINSQARLGSVQSLLQALNPETVLQRGYALIRDQDGSYITKQAQYKVGETVAITQHGFTVQATVKEVK